MEMENILGLLVKINIDMKENIEKITNMVSVECFMLDKENISVIFKIIKDTVKDCSLMSIKIFIPECGLMVKNMEKELMYIVILLVE